MSGNFNVKNNPDIKNDGKGITNGIFRGYEGIRSLENIEIP